MVINNSIIHQLSKERNSKSTINLRESILQVNNQLNQLLCEIKKVYNEKTGKSYGVFENNITLYPLSVLLKKYLTNEISFIEFTKEAMNLLKNKIDTENLATGGYLLFVHYDCFFMVVMLNDKNGVSISNDTLDIIETNHLDLEKLHLAARIDLTLWQSEGSKYLSFVKGRNTGDYVSNYFREFIGCTDYTSSKEQTELLLVSVDNYCKQKEFDDERKKSFKHSVFEYCENKRKNKELVYLEDLSHYLDEDNPNDFFEFANSNEAKLNSGFEPHRDTLSRLQRYNGKDSDLIISFNSDLLGNRVIFNRVESTLLINKLPKDLEIQLNKMYEDESI